MSQQTAKLVSSQYRSYVEREIARLTRLTCRLGYLALCRLPYVVIILCSEENEVITLPSDLYYMADIKC